MSKRIALVTSRHWNLPLAEEMKRLIGSEVLTIQTPEEFTLERIDSFQPDWVFVPHWSHIIPKNIHDAYNVVIFHMTDLPYGRGGSPLQNLIVRNHTSTMISAIACRDGLDEGPVYLKRELSLEGSAQEIFLRARDIILKMMLYIVAENPTPTPQVGEPVYFKRRCPSDSDLSKLHSLKEIFDWIRMMDSDEYPHAYLEGPNWKATFTEAVFDGKTVHAKVTFKSRT